MGVYGSWCSTRIRKACVSLMYSITPPRSSENVSFDTRKHGNWWNDREFHCSGRKAEKWAARRDLEYTASLYKTRDSLQFENGVRST
jgi:hypothetical protein